jgi:hypothetical protein
MVNFQEVRVLENEVTSKNFNYTIITNSMLIIKNDNKLHKYLL